MYGFSYLMEFYKQKIFDINDKDYLYNAQIAEKVEKYFSKILPNIQYVREYIIMSFKLCKENLNYLSRMRYIKGIIYASDYIDSIDISEFPNQYQYLKDNGIYGASTYKESLWHTLYLNKHEDYENYLKKLIDLTYDVQAMNYVATRIGEDDTKDYEEQENDEEENEEFDDYENDSINEYGHVLTQDSSVSELVSAIMDQMNFANTVDFLGVVSQRYNYEPYIRLEDKLNYFINYKDYFIETIINHKLKNNRISEKDIPMIKTGMNDWFDYAFAQMKHSIVQESYFLSLNDKNISDYL